MAFKLRKYFEPRLAPARAARIYTEFEQTRGYHRYHEFCRAQFTRTAAGGADPDFVRLGYLPVDVMTPTVAASLLARSASGATPDYLKKDTKNLRGFRTADHTLVAALLEAALPPAVDAQIAAWFGSEYLVHWHTVSATEPGPVPASVSFRWHCDKGPRQHLKLLIYLNDAAEHGGATAFINLEDGAAVAATGYLFGRAKRRTTELVELSALAGRPIATWQPQVRAGSAVLFQPSTVLHCGVMPTLGTRYALTLCLLPSPVPWREACRRGAMSDLMHEDLWHTHAATLLEQTGFAEAATALRT